MNYVGTDLAKLNPRPDEHFDRSADLGTSNIPLLDAAQLGDPAPRGAWGRRRQARPRVRERPAREMARSVVARVPHEQLAAPDLVRARHRAVHDAHRLVGGRRVDQPAAVLLADEGDGERLGHVSAGAPCVRSMSMRTSREVPDAGVADVADSHTASTVIPEAVP